MEESRLPALSEVISAQFPVPAALATTIPEVNHAALALCQGYIFSSGAKFYTTVCPSRMFVLDDYTGVGVSLLYATFLYTPGKH